MRAALCKKCVPVVLFLVTLAGCSAGEEEIYTALTRMAEQEYSLVSLEVSVTLNGFSLSGNFVSFVEEEQVTVHYRYEQATLIEEGEGGFILPDAAKAVREGEMTFADGKVVSAGGFASDLPLDFLTARAFCFRSEVFGKTEQTTGRFSAAVNDPSAFLGTPLSAEDMELSVRYAEEGFRTADIIYSSPGGAKVHLGYSFQK